MIAAVFTAFDGAGSVALDAIEQQAALLQRQGVDGAFVCGSTGEGPSLSSEERIGIARRWCEVADGLEVIVHVGHTSLPEARTLAAAAFADGADGIAAFAPYYFAPAGPEALVDFCGEVAAAAPTLPFLYYHIPQRTHVHPPMPDFLDLARRRIPSFAGVKFTSPDLVEMARCVEAAAPDVTILSGPDELLLQALTVGVRGAVGSTYNLAAPHYRAVFEAFGAGDMTRATELQGRARRLIQIAIDSGGLPALKAMSRWLDVDCGGCRLPLRGLDAAGEAALRSAVEAAGLLDLFAPPSAEGADL
ncbi:MAG: dihydrodipicolinate synthase family protein [Candidatus Dormiibacterota bacterium]